MPGCRSIARTGQSVRLLLAAASVAACTGGGAIGEPLDLVLYSPAPPNIMLDTHNRALAAQLASCDAFGTVETVPVALPEAIDMIRSVDAAEQPYHLPIMTVLDFQTAVDGTAPDWHAYEPAASEMRFVTSLYDVAFGILVFDPDIETPQDLAGKRIGVPARPSSVRWFTESLLRDGWGVLDDVTLVDIAPPDLPGAVQRGEVDATSWSIMSETREGFLPLIPPLLSTRGAHWVDVDEATLAAVNAANPFETELVDVQAIAGGGDVSASLLSFAQGLAAWAHTPDAVVTDIAACLEGADMGFGPGRYSASGRFDWPGLRDSDVHSALSRN